MTWTRIVLAAAVALAVLLIVVIVGPRSRGSRLTPQG
jgi:hypothetical protein